jgi:hypothetical protein
MRGLTQERWIPYHRGVLARLCSVAQSLDGVSTHTAGLEYTSLMSCFLMHNVSGGRALLSLLDSAGPEWFPSTHGFAIARTMFETDVTAHYISKLPGERASQYILFEHILNKRAMEACRKHRASDDPGWREAMTVEWESRWAEREADIDNKYDEVKSMFTRPKGREFDTWSGLSIRALASEVDHDEAYDTFYAQLSSFTHGDIHSANRFLRLRSDSPFWSQRANWYDVGEVLHAGALVPIVPDEALR